MRGFHKYTVNSLVIDLNGIANDDSNVLSKCLTYKIIKTINEI